jgi:SAM-dependent methyltransferase
MNNKELYNAAEAWKKELQQEGYEHHCHNVTEMEEIRRLNRTWKKILKLTKLHPHASVFELGCGGGHELAKLAVWGYEVYGIDISLEVIVRAKHYLKEVDNYYAIKANVEVGDIFEYESPSTYDMCFHVGVIEHYLETGERQTIWGKLYDLTKPGGWIVSVVPCGHHFMRKTMREKGLGGYNIPEIDYSIRLHKEEFEQIGLNPIYAQPHSYFGFFSMSSNIISKFIYYNLYLLGNIVIPYLPINNNIKEKYASSLIIIGQK